MYILKRLASWGAVFLFGAGCFAVEAAELLPEEQLGKSIFFDENLSFNRDQSCASCHGQEAGWTGPESGINAHGAVYEGSIPGRFGNRKPPSAAYAAQSPIFHMDKHGLFVGGNFWDGRATGEKLGNPSADQAQGPFLNPKEQALPDSACVVYRVCGGDDYPVSYQQVWGDEACKIFWPSDVETVCSTEDATVGLSEAERAKANTAYDNIALSIAAYEASPEVSAFSSKYDNDCAEAKLTKEEHRGRALFQGKAKCSRCHISNGQEPLFTDYTFDNLGIPKNPENPVYDYDPGFIDTGLGGFLASLDPEQYPLEMVEEEWGKQKVPTLRNVAKGSCEAEPLNPDCITKAYGHNGYFKTLEGIVHFYNTRDVLPECPLNNDGSVYTEDEANAAGCWPAPEVDENVNEDELGDLGLTPDEEAAIVAFMMTLSDGFDCNP
jgi:cytochrome c peroxidase